MRILVYLRNLFFVAKYGVYSLLNNRSGGKPGVTDKKRRVQLIVSLTSHPGRFETVFLTIESLLNQSRRPDKIILWLAREEVQEKELPTTLTRLKSRGLDIRIVEENIRSYKKLIYAVAEFDRHLIVTCDDDRLYPKWFLRELYRSWRQYPDCISAYRCRVMWKTNDRFAPYEAWRFAGDKKPSYHLFPTSGGGTLYPPGCLHQKTGDRIFMELAPFADDVWYKAMSLLNQTRVVMVKEKSTDFPFIDVQGAQRKTLWHINIVNNDAQIQNVFDYFDLHRRITGPPPR